MHMIRGDMLTDSESLMLLYLHFKLPSHNIKIPHKIHAKNLKF